MCAKRIKFLMTRLSVCGLGVSCNEMSDTPMLLVVPYHMDMEKKAPPSGEKVVKRPPI